MAMADEDIARADGRQAGPRSDRRPIGPEQRAEMCGWARRFSRRGMPMFPVRGKRPLAAGWRLKATVDPGRIRAHLDAFPRATGYLLAMGGEAPEGGRIFALDVDPRNGGTESLARLLADIGLDRLPPTAETRTGGHEAGRHLFFTAPERVRNGPLRGYPGLDLKGPGGYVLGPGSIHPDTGRPYQCLRGPWDGIAAAPAPLIALLGRADALREGRSSPTGTGASPGRTREKTEDPASTLPRTRPTGPLPVPSGRSGVLADVTRDLIRSHPVPGPGARWCRMRGIVARLIGAGWYEHFDRQGVIGTGSAGHAAELEVLIRSTRANPDFRPSRGHRDHRAECRAIPIAEDVTRFIRRGGFLPAAGSPHPPPPNSKRLARIGFGLSDRSVAFVVAALVIALHKDDLDELGRDGVIRMTHAQLIEVAADRHPEVRWDPKAIDREKSRWVLRIGAGSGPAASHPLLREVKKGKPGEASEYEPVGLRGLMAMARPTGIAVAG
jgi:hypothetical protein